MLAEALAAAAHALGADRDRVLARLGGSLGEGARGAAAALDGRDLRPTGSTAEGGRGSVDRESDSRRLRAEWAARARVPVPAGLRGVHATWIEAALAELPPRARIALAGGPAEPDGGDGGIFDSAPRPIPGASDADATGDAVARGVHVWLARWATARFVPLEPVRPGPPRAPADLGALAPDAAVRWLTDVGLDQLAFALAGEPAARAAALGAAFGAAQARIALPPRAGQLGPRRAALERSLDVAPLDTDDLVVLGARTVAPFVPALARVALALRLPEPLGARVLAAFVAHARADPARGPAWTALAAG